MALSSTLHNDILVIKPHLNHAWFKVVEGLRQSAEPYMDLHRFTNLHLIGDVKPHNRGSRPHNSRKVVKLMHPVTRKCPCCGSAFTTDNLKRKYCSDTCRNTHQMRKKRARSKARKARIETSAAREALEGKTHLSISEAAKFLGVSRPTLYARIEQGELTPLRVSSRTVRIPIEQLQVDSQLKPQPAKGDWSVLISKAEVLQKYNISESWLMRRMKEEGFRPRIIKGKAFYPKKEVDRLFKPTPVYNKEDWYNAEDLMQSE